jgi:hypothetical protein
VNCFTPPTYTYWIIKIRIIFISSVGAFFGITVPHKLPIGHCPCSIFFSISVVSMTVQLLLLLNLSFGLNWVERVSYLLLRLPTFWIKPCVINCIYRAFISTFPKSVALPWRTLLLAHKNLSVNKWAPFNFQFNTIFFYSFVTLHTTCFKFFDTTLGVFYRGFTAFAVVYNKNPMETRGKYWWWTNRVASVRLLWVSCIDW